METIIYPTIQSCLISDIVQMIKQHNINSKLNNFLYKNEDCNEFIKELTGQDRWQFVTKNNKIERELITYIHDNFHNRKCIVNGKEGVIKQEKTREFENRTYDNSISFRREYEDSTYSAPETIALWVETDNKMTSHLYTVNNIHIIFY